ncbi:hypothetical protein ACVIRO_005559 [Rhizobium ruizarguesonis]|nr:hypothetical protein G7039_35580 [Rhizobium leguminosarum]
MTVTWDIIKGYFTDMDVDHMKQVSGSWPKPLDLHDEQSVLYYAAQIHASVKSGTMPIGEPRWSQQCVDDFYQWWHSMDPAADAKRIG